jgi:hypothetical protein
MPGKFYYHEIIRRTTAAFGSMFNDIYILHKDGEGDDLSYIKVPIAYGPVQKFLARIEQKPELRNRMAITLPRMSFEIGQLSYDATRKSSTLQTFKTITPGTPDITKAYMPVPYNLPFSLTIATKYNDDMFQIIEQILPVFKPEFNLSVNLTSTLGEKRDIPIVLQGVSPFQDDYEGDYSSRRFIQCTLTFIAKIFLFGPMPTDGNQNKLIKKVQVDYYSNTNTINASRQLRYTVTPRAIDDYNNDNTTSISQNIDDLVTQFTVSDTTSLPVGGYIQINSENMFIKAITGNKLTVLRAQDNTIKTNHYDGDIINIINQQDNDLIVPGDDFEFNEELFDFGDGRIYSPRKDSDV